MQATALNLNRYDFSRRIAIFAIALIVVCFAGWRFTVAQSAAISIETHALVHDDPGSAGSHGAETHPLPPAFYSVVPFAALLLSIAFLPLFHATEHWWENNINRLLVSAGLGTLTLLYYCFGYHQGVIDHTTHALSAAGIPAAVTVFKNAILVEYIPFITLLFSLYVISGGISVQGHFVGTPKFNSGIIAIWGLLARLIGTTGAAMPL
ncbi:MAG: sodium:proton antiporter, partial [Planctomycetes bacterium]|nr:sodium:proton antiporter [Planctomycetota bacterium]